MYDYIKGEFVSKSSGSKGFYATVEASGVGYLFEITERDYNNLPPVGEKVKLYSILIHREDKMSLCGFLKKEDRDIFNILTLVSGVGSKMALVLLNSFEVPELIGFVLDENYKALTVAKGVGAKVAQKIILELKDKLIAYQGNEPVKSSSPNSVSMAGQNVEDARLVLASLGYEKNEISSVLSVVCDKLPQNASAEEILKAALKLLSV